MLKLYENIKSRRLSLNMTQSELAEMMGYADKSMIAKIEKGVVDLSQSKIIAFADALNTTPGNLMELDEIKSGVKIKVLEHVSADTPISAGGDMIDIEAITEKIAKTGEFFGLKIKDNSMAPTICDGDVVIVRQQDDAESGDTIIATISSNEATCKRLRKYKDGIELISNNPAYDPLDFSNKEIMEKPVKIIGKVIELRRKF